ncbi:IclR family transcriptional regulator [Arthrobacter sp. 08Y14]|uniref:IclR family transcriptional regulator n=1 Tax=Arthrobacter sp. 08Y14 TaxID=2058885 RepID=UPI000CE410ED|nr:IclR family transcriptional regulator [Arthrobacter sp. 08Y14]
MSISLTAPPVAWPPAPSGPPPAMAARMTLIMEVFDSRSVRLLLDEIASRTRLPRSTTHRILDQLVQLGWLEHTPDGYGMGWRSLQFGGLDNGNSRIRAEAAPLLHSLQIRTGMVVHLAVLNGTNIHYLDKAGGRSATSVPSRVGGNAPAHATALGKSMLAWINPEQLDEMFRHGLSANTPRTIRDVPALYAELNRIRQRGGLAYESGESYEGISCVAAAIRNRREPVASISLVGTAGDPIERVAPLVLDAARRVSAALFPGDLAQDRHTGS